jgi:hypothetical protein
LKRLPCKRRAMSCRSASSESESDSNSSRSGDARQKQSHSSFGLLVFSSVHLTVQDPSFTSVEKLERVLCETGRFLYG